MKSAASNRSASFFGLMAIVICIMGHLSKTPVRAPQNAEPACALDGGTMETVSLALDGCQLLSLMPRP